MIRTSIRLAVLSCLSAACIPAQDLRAALHAFAVTTVDHELHAVGADYDARFTDGGIEYTPALGRRAPQSMPLGYRLRSVHRGSATVFERDGVAAAPHADGNSVRYDHRADLAEVYEARADGIEQSFVFAARPGGQGDLVVVGDITTQLTTSMADTEAGLRFELAGLGGVSIGGVTGVDANGATVAGTVRIIGSRVEFVLPAGFVDQACYPLVLDPLIGTAFQIGNEPGVDTNPCVAYDASAQNYCVAWEVTVSATLSYLRAQLVSATGALVGPVVSIGGLQPGQRPAVVDIRASHRFLVAWHTATGQGSTHYCAAIDAATGTTSNSVQVQLNLFDGNTITAGGDLRAVGSHALVVYSRPSSPQTNEVLEARVVNVPASGSPLVGPAIQITQVVHVAPSTFDQIAVTKSAGASGRWLVTWVQSHGIVQCVAVSETGSLCSPVALVTAALPPAQVQSLACATRDGDHFVVAWHYHGGGGIESILMRPVSMPGVCPSALSLGSTLYPVQNLGVNSQPAIDFAEDRYLLVWRQLTGGSYRVFARALDPETCVDCGSTFAVDSNASPQDHPDLVTRFSGGDASSNEALVVWSNSTIRGVRVVASGQGTVTSMGGGCGAAGTDLISHDGYPVIGNREFAITLTQPTAPILAMVIGFSNASIPCGTCTLVPALDVIVATGSPMPLPIPCDTNLIGADIYAQWLQFRPNAGCPLFPLFGMSNALRFTIGE